MWGQVDTRGWFFVGRCMPLCKIRCNFITNLIPEVGFYDSQMLGYIYHELSKYWAEYMTLTLSI